MYWPGRAFASRPTEAQRLTTFQPEFRRYNTRSPLLKDSFLPDQLLRQPELAATLTRLRDDGPSDFYRGQTARLIVEEMQEGGGLISAQDLADYSPLWRSPITTSYQRQGHLYELISMPP
ncbi:MAG: gamma-glutamyltransferase, partial [Lewinella sp.]|nr:gamma-glutamyltransferase [Lewinella sp.]